MAPELANRQLRASLSDTGLLTRIDDVTTGRGRDIANDGWAVTLGDRTIRDRDAVLAATDGSVDGHRFGFRVGSLSLELRYELAPAARTLRRMINVGPVDRPTSVTEVTYGPLAPDPAPADVVRYDTFWNSPTVTFLRWTEDGWCIGVEEPSFVTYQLAGGLAQGYSPGVILAPGQSYTADAQFVGPTRLTGEMVAAEPPRSRVTVGEPWRRGRFRDPMGQVPIDRGEIHAMRNHVSDFLGPGSQRFLSILYSYWYPLPQPPLDASGEERWCAAIDRFAGLGGDLLMTVPLHRSALPLASPAAYWDIAPAGSASERILRHARRKGVRVGLYMGVAAGNLEHGNAAGLDYPADAPDDWKKIGEDGVVSGENCMASDAFMEWSIAVQANTIDRFGLSGWSWDPGPGNGRFCHASHHGHQPGQGSHRGWRNATEVRRRLKERFPDLFLQAFYGQKEDGVWGLRHFDQHEAYWEQQVEWGASIHPEISSDRMDADGVRLQAWGCQNLRFLPARMNHALVGRITQYCMDDPELALPWDHAGWRYALLSGLAVGGSITATILPEDLAIDPDMAASYAAWLAWARRHQHLVAFDMALGSQVRPGGVDIHARVDGTKGMLFLANPGPRPVRTTVPLDPSIGLTSQGSYRLVIQTPAPGPSLAAPDGGSVFMSPGIVEVTVPAHTMLVVSLEPADRSLAGVVDSATLRGPTVAVDGWTDAAGELFRYPLHAAIGETRLHTRVSMDPNVVPRIVARAAADGGRVQAVVDTWRARGFPDTFAWARPDRLLLIVPFGDADQVGEVTLRIDGRDAQLDRFTVAPPGDTRLSGEPLPGRLPGTTVCWWADVTHALSDGGDHDLELGIRGLAPNQFLGPWLEAPGARWDLQASGISIEGGPVAPLTGPVPDLRLPIGRSGTRPPRVLEAWLEPPVLRAGQEVTIHARLDRDQRHVSGVFCSTLVGPGVFTDVALAGYGGDRWSYRFQVGDRREVILDPPASHVWAVDMAGTAGPSMAIPMRWTLQPRRSAVNRLGPG